MPIKDDAKRRAYFAKYMRERRAGQKPEPKNSDDRQAEVNALKERIRVLEAELARERVKKGRPTPQRSNRAKAAAAKRKAEGGSKS
jgi:hypothetical protein